jgi:hypothetical protein
VQGFGAQVRGALRAREVFLVEHGFAEQQGQRVVLARNLLATLRVRELQATATAIASERGSYTGRLRTVSVSRESIGARSIL